MALAKNAGNRRWTADDRALKENSELRGNKIGAKIRMWKRKRIT
jgi:hypothetical protein